MATSPNNVKSHSFYVSFQTDVDVKESKANSKDFSFTYASPAKPKSVKAIHVFYEEAKAGEMVVGGNGKKEAIEGTTMKVYSTFVGFIKRIFGYATKVTLYKKSYYISKRSCRELVGQLVAKSTSRDKNAEFFLEQARPLYYRISAAVRYAFAPEINPDAEQGVAQMAVGFDRLPTYVSVYPKTLENNDANRVAAEAAAPASEETFFNALDGSEDSQTEAGGLTMNEDDSSVPANAHDEAAAPASEETFFNALDGSEDSQTEAGGLTMNEDDSSVPANAHDEDAAQPANAHDEDAAQPADADDGNAAEPAEPAEPATYTQEQLAAAADRQEKSSSLSSLLAWFTNSKPAEVAQGVHSGPSKAAALPATPAAPAGW